MPYMLHRGERKLKLKDEQLTAKSIGQVFRLFPDSIVLITEDGSVETANDQGHFTDLRPYLSYEVHGDSLGSSQGPGSNVPQAIQRLVTSPSVPRPTSARRGISVKMTKPAKPPGVAAKESCQWTKSIEINHLSNGVLEKFSNFPILLNEATASISHISQQLSQEVFGGKEVLLIDVDELPVPDTIASRGMKYWKTLKKIKAVSADDYRQYRGRSEELDNLTSDDDFEPSKRRKKAVALGSSSSLRSSLHRYSPVPYLISSDEEDGDVFGTSPKALPKGKGKMLRMEKNRYKNLEERIHVLETKIHQQGTSSPPVCMACNKIKELFKCFICSNTVKSAFHLTCCGNGSCISQWAISNSTCPFCRQQIDANTKPPLPRSLVEILQMTTALSAEEGIQSRDDINADPSSSSSRADPDP